MTYKNLKSFSICEWQKIKKNPALNNDLKNVTLKHIISRPIINDNNFEITANEDVKPYILLQNSNYKFCGNPGHICTSRYLANKIIQYGVYHLNVTNLKNNNIVKTHGETIYNISSGMIFLKKNLIGFINVIVS